MANLQVEYLEKLTPARRQKILSRSQEDVGQVLETVRPILEALRREGDAENLRQHGLKPGYSIADLVVKEEEIQAAYRTIDPKVLDALKAAAANIEKFHRA
jgi:histidinol dehydrogenase